MVIFLAYRGSLAFPAVCVREVNSQSLTKGNTSNDKMEALLAKINSETLGRILLDIPDDICYGELKAKIKNSFAEGDEIYPPDVLDTLTRAQNYTVPKRSFIRNRDTLAFTTVGGENGGGTHQPLVQRHVHQQGASSRE